MLSQSHIDKSRLKRAKEVRAIINGTEVTRSRLLWHLLIELEINRGRHRVGKSQICSNAVWQVHEGDVFSRFRLARCSPFKLWLFGKSPAESCPGKAFNYLICFNMFHFWVSLCTEESSCLVVSDRKSPSGASKRAGRYTLGFLHI